MTVIGVTGGIGSGKTTFCKFLENYGATFVSADAFAKDLMTNDPELKQQIISVFGRESYLSDGSLNRSYLSEQAFKQGQVNTLNKLVHPVVRTKLIQLLDQFRSNDVQIVVYEAALLLNEGRPDYVNVVIWVESDVDQRVSRVVLRDNIDAEQVNKRVLHQREFESVREFVDIVIHNNSDLQHLKDEAKRVMDMYTSTKK